MTSPLSEETRSAWTAFWAGTNTRPMAVARVRRPRTSRPAEPAGRSDSPYANAVRGDHALQMARHDEALAETAWLGDAVPYFSPDHGPDQFAAILAGQTLRFTEGDLHTNWMDPVVTDWEGFAPRLDPASPTWRSLLTYAAALREHARGRYAVGVCDLHSNLDALSALRGPENLCLDFYECPEAVDRALGAVRALYRPIYDALREASGHAASGCIGWLPAWCADRFAVIQCDFICLISPELARRYVLPALEEESRALDHCIYHLDGPGALPHLDDLLALPRIDAVQWVPGAGQPEQWEWPEVLRRIQAAGKALILHLPPDLALFERLGRELDPRRLILDFWAPSEDEARRCLDWIHRHLARG